MDITSTTFKSEVLDHPGVVLVDFWAVWCGPCQMLAPVIEEIAKDLGDKLKVAKLDVDANPEVANQYNVTSIPTVIIFDHGQIKNTIIGFRQKQEYLSAL